MPANMGRPDYMLTEQNLHEKHCFFYLFRALFLDIQKKGGIIFHKFVEGSTCLMSFEFNAADDRE